MKTPKQQWEELKQVLGLTFAETIQRIDEIDKQTPWQPDEPSWWLEMMEERARLLKCINDQKQKEAGRSQNVRPTVS